MSVEWYAPVVVLVGLWLWLRGSVLDSVVAMLVFALFGGGAALLIGQASIQPVSLFLVFLVGHVLLSMFRRSSHVELGLKTNGYLAFFCLYGALTAFILPRLFARTMAVPPMQVHKHDIYYTALLGFSKQNITTAIYLIGTLLASVTGGAAAADPESRRKLVKWGGLIAWAHIGFGIAGVLFPKIGLSHVITFFRNAHYAELDEATLGLVRIAGIFPEPSAYGGFAFTWFVLMAELWLRNVRPVWTGLTTTGLFIIIVLCTSTSTYFAVVVYAAVMLVRWLSAPGGLRNSKIVMVGMGALAALTLVLAVAAFVPNFTAWIGRAMASVTTHKLTSTSGMGRTFWAKAGLTTFIKSYGVGVGAGSFRCSSLLLAIMGSMGVVGVAAFAGHVLKILRPLQVGTYQLGRASRDPVAAAAAWAACMGLLPAIVSAPSPDPSYLFAILGGLALGWRYLPVAAPSPASAPAPIWSPPPKTAVATT